MNSAEVSSLITEFEQTYKDTATPSLPKKLSNYRFYSCLADSDHKKTWILENANGQKVLCKYASGEYAEMLRTESGFGTLGKFPFVPYVFDYFETGNGAYLLREYVEGQTLNELVEREGTLPLPRVISLIEQLCGHLSRLHSSNPPIIYRDLKPSNIVLHPSGDCYLVDMGTVRTYNEDHSLDTVFIGTIDTAAPEQFGARQTDNRTDIYALGILFYYLLTGDVKIQEEKLKTLPSKAASVIRKCTAFNPDDRYSQVMKVAAALRPSARFTAGFTAAAASLCTAAVIFICLVISNFLLHDSASGNSVADAFAKNNGSSGSLTPESTTPESPTPQSSGTEDPVEIVFNSSLLEQAVRNAVNKTNGEPVYEEDLVRISRLEVCHETVLHSEDRHLEQYRYLHTMPDHSTVHGDISDLSLLAKMPNLHYLVLDYQQIYDLSPLADLHLVSLSIMGNPVLDLSPLSDQKNLTELYLTDTDVISLEPLRTCSALSLLDCSDTNVLFLEPITSLPLDMLLILNTSVRDFEVLSDTSLQYLVCNHMPKESIDLISRISSLKGLTIYSSDITSLKELSSFNHLVQLDVFSNQITNLDGLEQFTDLKDLILDNNPITDLDLSPLAKMTNLSSLGIRFISNADPGIDMDFSFLNELSRLEFLTINPSQADALYEAVPEPWFYVNTLE